MEYGRSSASGKPSAGVRILGRDARAGVEIAIHLRAWLQAQHLDVGPAGPVHLSASPTGVRISLRTGATQAWAPGRNTLELTSRLGLHVDRPEDLQREIVIGLLMSPVVFDFPSVEEFESAVRIRMHTVHAAQRTLLEFAPHTADRPTDCWDYDEDRGFTVRKGSTLIDALRKATQPDASGKRYAFSCYRATEYVMLLAIAQEAAQSNLPLLSRIESLATHRAIRSREFHEVYLREYGSMRHPLPLRYFVPGDRVWFHNPHAASAAVEGYEGSWVIYLGAGLFCNFWEVDRPFTLQRKCLEIFHWRHAITHDAHETACIDEAEVARRVTESLSDPGQLDEAMRRMYRPRAPRGLYDQGGCMDTTRECARWIRPGSSDIDLPAH